MKTLSCLVALSLVVAAYAVSAVPPRLDAVSSPTRSFLLNGRWFSVGKPSRSDAVMREELAARGVDVSRIPRETGDLNDILIDGLSELPSTTIRSRHFSAPFSIRRMDGLQMESEAATVDISIGNVSPGKNRTTEDLVAKGWEVAETGKYAAPSFMAAIRNGRETSVVFVEEKTGSCLFIRRLEK